VLVLVGPGSGLAKAASGPRISVTPTTVGAGDVLIVRLSNSGGRRCILSLRADRYGARARYTRRIRAGRTTIEISARAAVGGRVVKVKCGARSATVRFRVVSGGVRHVPATPKAPVPDEQGFVAGAFGSQEEALIGAQLGGGDYPNSRITESALSKVGQNLFTPGPLDHGQCKQAVNDWIAQASGGTQRLGTDYYSNYARNGGQQVSRDSAVEGDIIQLDNPSDITNYYRGMHTAVVVSHGVGSNSFDVVDSNFQLDDVVRHHPWDPYAAGQKYGLRVTIWRMGTVAADMTEQQPQPTPAPHPAPSYLETTGGVTHTWTNYANAGGGEGPAIPSNVTVQIACKVPGFRVSDGNTWWYRIASSPWSGGYYASADAFYNNGQTSGSLHGTPFVDPNVADC
jgi:hypothetical protein